MKFDIWAMNGALTVNKIRFWNQELKSVQSQKYQVAYIN